MEVDVGCVWPKSGTASQYPGTDGAFPMEIDDGNFGSDPGTSHQHSGTGRAMVEEIMKEIMATKPMEIDERLFPLHPVPEWVEQIMNFIADGSLPRDTTEARRI